MPVSEVLFLLILAIGAYLVPFFARLLRLPTAVAEILFGVSLSAMGVHSSSSGPVAFLSELGFVFLMYLAGMEIEWGLLRARGRGELILLFSFYLAMMPLALMLPAHLGLPPVGGVLLILTAVGLLFPVLKEANLLHQPLGQNLLLLGTVGEVVSLLVFTLFGLWARFGWSLQSIRHLGQILVFALAAALIRRCFFWITWWFPALLRPFAQFRDDAVQLGMRGTLVIVLLFVGMAGLLGLEPIVGAFLGGAIFGGLLHQKERIKSSVGGMAYGFLVPIFFMEVGMKLPLHLLGSWNIWQTALLLSGGLVLVRVLVAPLLLGAGFQWAQIPIAVMATGFPLTLLVAVGLFAFEHHLMPEATLTATMLAAMLTGVAGPMVLKLLLGQHLRNRRGGG